MRPIISILSCFAFLFHLGVGCCTHHSHAMGGSSRFCLVAMPADSHASHSCHHADSDKSTLGSECPGENCDHGSCTFIGASTAEMAKTTADGLAVVPFSKLPNLLAKSQNPVGNTQKFVFLPVRIHLFNQLLLN